MKRKGCRVTKLCVACVLLALVCKATIITLWTVAFTSDDGDDITAPWDRYRLPATLLPDHYNVSLWPRLTPDPGTGLYIFTGSSSVEFKCVQATDVILIHSNKLNYTIQNGGHLVRLSAGPGVEVPSIRRSWLKVETQYLVVELAEKLKSGASYKLFTEFTGELADDLGGFYRSEYVEDGVKKVVATSQMHPTNTRRTFPCFDEPAIKAVFHITLTHDPGTTALSNGKETEVTNRTIDGVAVSQTEFEPTKRMSTYLLALIVSDFSHLSAQQGDVLIRIWARRRAVEEGQCDYALNLTGPILDFFQHYYNITYPLSKSDQIALPDFYFGAMENWGLVTYRETNLLYDSASASNRNRQTTASIIAHELAHMWFGNLVTLRWWNEVWLNEGFASYVSYLGADHAEPSWDLKDLMVLDEVHRVFAVDALASSHPLSSKEQDIILPEQISEQFDIISYSKGAAVLRMLSDFLSEPVFVQGLNSYLNHFAYGNTVGSDLWDHLQKAVEANGVLLPARVDAIMNRWVLQMGFPVVTIETTTGAVSQQHFLLDPESSGTVASPYNYEWLVPICWMRAGELQPATWLMEKTAVYPDMESGGDWILANINVTGYYRVNYDSGNWERLLTQLTTDHQRIPLINRAQLVDDAFNLARAGLVPTTLALRTTIYLSAERHYLAWQTALNNMLYYHNMLDQTPEYPHIQSYMKKLVTPLFLFYKNQTSEWTAVPTGHMDQYNQVNAIRTACNSGLEECNNLTTSWFRHWMDLPDTNQIHPNLRAVVYCSAVAAGGAEEWDFSWSQFRKAAVASEASKLMAALACTTDRQLLQRLLTHSLDSGQIRKQDATSVIISVANNRAGQQLAWDFLSDNWTYMFTQYGVGSFNFASLISGVTARFSTPEHLQQLQQFIEQHAETGFGSATLALDQSLERTAANINWLQHNQQDVLDWFINMTE